MKTLAIRGVLFNWLQGLKSGPLAAPNPFGGNTLEWATSSPPPHDNFPTPPEAGDPYEMGRWKQVSEYDWQPDPNYKPELHAHH